MLMAKDPLSPSNLDRMVSKLLTTSHGRIGTNLDLFGFFVHAGATGDGVAALLVAATAENLPHLRRLLVQKSSSVRLDDAQAFRVAIESSNIDVLKELSQLQIGPDAATRLCERLPNGKREPFTNLEMEMMTILLEQGASGSRLHKALEKRVQARDNEAVRKLLEHNASVSYNQGRALVVAIRAKNTDLLDLLLGHNPDNQSLITAISSAVTLSSIDMLQLILGRDVCGQDPVDAAFDKAMDLSVNDDLRTSKLDLLLENDVSLGLRSNAIVQEVRSLAHSGQDSPHVLERLILSGGDVNAQGGEAFRLAASSAQLHLLQILIAARPTREVLIPRSPQWQSEVLEASP